MSLQEQHSPLQYAFIAFVVATAVGLSIGVLVFGDPLEEAAVTAVPIGLGVGISFYIFESVGRR